MNDKPKLSTKEEIFDVFRPGGDHDVSAENYRPKKQVPSQSRQGPVEKNHFTDAKVSAPNSTIEPHSLILSGADALRGAVDQMKHTTATPDIPPPQTTIRLETFRIGMEERLAAMLVAQQKAKDQLSDLEDQSPDGDKLPDS